MYHATQVQRVKSLFISVWHEHTLSKSSAYKTLSVKDTIHSLGDCIWFHFAIIDSYGHWQIQTDLVNLGFLSYSVNLTTWASLKIVLMIFAPISIHGLLIQMDSFICLLNLSCSCSVFDRCILPALTWLVFTTWPAFYWFIWFHVIDAFLLAWVKALAEFFFFFWEWTYFFSTSVCVLLVLCAKLYTQSLTDVGL